MTSISIDVMATIQAEKLKEIGEARTQMTPEEIALAEMKRKTFDIPTTALKVDPLR